MGQQKKSLVPAIVLGTVMILTLPLVYLLVAKVILPLEWDEPQFKEAKSSSVSD